MGNAQGVIDRVLTMVEALTRTEGARLAGEVLAQIGISRDVVVELAKSLSEDDYEELKAQIEVIEWSDAQSEG